MRRIPEIAFLSVGSPGFRAGGGVLENAVAKGVLSSETVLDEKRLYQLSLAVNPGNSGGPVFGTNGRVIGVVVSKSTAEEAIGFCIPVVDLVSLMQSQSRSGLRSTANSVAQYDVRKVLRAVRAQVIVREYCFDEGIRVAEQADIRPVRELSANFLTSIQGYYSDNPMVTGDLSHDLLVLRSNAFLTSLQKSKVEKLYLSYLAIQQLITKPPLRTSDCCHEFEDRHTQFYEQLKSLEQSIELGRL